MGSSTSEATQLSNTCFWNALESLSQLNLTKFLSSRPQAQKEHLGVHSSTLRLLSTRTPQSRRVASTVRTRQPSRRWSRGSLASISFLATFTTQRPLDLRKNFRTARSRRNVPTPSSPALPRSCRPSPCSRRARAAMLCRAILQNVPHPASAATIWKRRRWRSALRSAQRRRATELLGNTVLSLGVLPLPLGDVA